MKAEIRSHNGTPTIFLNDRPVFANFNLLSPFDGDYREPSLPVARKFGELGIHLYSIDSIITEWCGPRKDDPSHYDFSTVGPRLHAILDQNPNAHFLLRMGFETRGLPGRWWNRAYPGELEIVAEEADSLPEIERYRSNCVEDANHITQSYASKIWQQHVKDLLRAYIRHLRSIGLYDRVIAYQIAAGASGEWVKGDSDQMNRFGDYSQPMLKHFRAWLRRKYGNYVFSLRKAWDDDHVTFDTADVPLPQEHYMTRHGVFRDPAREQKVIDYYICLSELCADLIAEFCGVVKDETNGEKLTGAFFGYLMDLAWNVNFFGGSHAGPDYSTIQRCGHLGLARLLRSPNIDFLVSPYSYAFRGIGGEGLAMQPSESCRLHGKIYLMEEDTLMHNRFETDGRMHSITDTPAIYKRHFAYCVTHGHGITWLQSSHYAEYPEIEAAANQLHAHIQKLGTWALQLDRRPQAEIAVLLDDESYYYTTVKNNISLAGVFYQRSISLARIGAPHDVYLLDDLIEGNIPPYKLYIFLNAFRLNRARREALARQIRRDGRVALWLYAPGYLYDDASSPAIPPPKDAPVAVLHTENMTDLTGIRFGKGDNPWALHMHITNFQHPITRDVPQDLFWGVQQPLAPIFHVEDPSATALGQVVYSLGRCKPGIAIKEFPNWTSIYVATPNLPAPILRGIARYAGVHLYNECGDVLYATAELLSVHTAGGGLRKFRLPQRVEVVYDLFEMREIARDTDEFEETLQPRSTRLWFVGARDKLMSLWASM
ncbi:MAG: hypothetical protein RMN52_07860 [Anaerolineae bacterium]|nr:beta-galactosidase [Candidatus Roseilinea sp.]MDW8449903.1 hypothetical protein [Anaerolineae bacterium]